MTTTKRHRLDLLDSRQDFEDAVNQIAELTTKMDKLTAERDAEIEETLSYCNPPIDSLKKEIDLLQHKAANYATAHWSDLAPRKNAKSAQCELAVYGFRTTTPRLKKKDARSDAEIAQLLQENNQHEFIIVEPKLNKKAILQAIKGKALRLLSRLFDVEQSETFYIKPKAQNIDHA